MTAQSGRNEIIVGNKPLSNYQGFVCSLLKNAELQCFVIKGYGHNISKAMILMDWIRKKFPYKLEDLKETRSLRGYIGIEIRMNRSKH